MRTLQDLEVNCVNGGINWGSVIKDALTFGTALASGVSTLVNTIKDGNPPPPRTDEMGNNY
jgi:hypothetical protein